MTMYNVDDKSRLRLQHLAVTNAGDAAPGVSIFPNICGISLHFSLYMMHVLVPNYYAGCRVQHFLRILRRYELSLNSSSFVMPNPSCGSVNV